ncbi:MAG: DUF4197 domain-containing protein [Magnetococcales bacterium]|nr:DUF4197 domain-containing protein [Magnetococcales bacterium]NGZ25314.1 DUF4197 domain-containing protein [Magnetococcales bacterium]
MMKKSLALVIFLLAIPSTVQAGMDDLLKQLPAAGQMLNNQGGGGSGGSVSSLGQQDMVSGLKEALGVGIKNAIQLLGRQNGFMGDPQVRIPLPPALQPMDKLMSIGPAKTYRDQFIGTLNQAAEKAVPVTADIFANSIRQMSIQDAAGILRGPNDAATQYFRKTSSNQLISAIRPIVSKSTQEAGVTSSYKTLTGSLPQSKLSLLSNVTKQDVTDLDGYVTGKAVDGLFFKLADEEKQIRTNPAARSSDLLQKVFGAAGRR